MECYNESVGRSFQFVTPNRRGFILCVCGGGGGGGGGSHMAGNVMCFRSDEEDMKIPGSVADSSGCFIPLNPKKITTNQIAHNKTRKRQFKKAGV